MQEDNHYSTFLLTTSFKYWRVLGAYLGHYGVQFSFAHQVSINW